LRCCWSSCGTCRSKATTDAFEQHAADATERLIDGIGGATELMRDLITGGAGSIATANQIAVRLAELAKAFKQDFAIPFGIDRLFFDFVGDELHNVIVQELNAVEVAAAKTEDFESSDCPAPGEKV
jgi:hypothetical protein